MSDPVWYSKNLGPVSAYAVAKRNGWTGTEAQWEALQAAAPQAGSDAEAFAAGTRSGTAVESDDPAYHNNAAYYNTEAGSSASAAASSKSDAEAFAAGTRGGTAVGSSDPAYHNNSKYYRDSAAAIAAGDVIDDSAGAGDTSLTWSADKLTSQKADIDDLKSALNGSLIPSTMTGWAKGSFNTETGADYSDNTRIRNQTLVGYSTGICRFKLNPGYKTLMFAWDLSGNYVGAYKTNGTWTKEVSNWKSVTEFDFSTVPNYVIKFSVTRDPSSSDITASEGDQVILYNYTDKTLTQVDKAADAKSTGDEFRNVKSAITSIEDKVGDIEELSVSFTNGKAIYYSNGKASNSSVLSYSGYKKIPEGYTKLRLAMVIRPDDVNTGMAFYTSNAESAYISGKKNKIDSTITGYGSEIIDIPIPSTAQYFRTSWIATTDPSYESNTFYCAFVKTGTMESELNQIETDLGEVESVADSNKMLTYVFHHLVDYQNQTNYDLPASGSTTETAIGVKREGNMFTLNGSNTSRAVTIKASGAVERAVYDSTVQAWSSNLVFPAGKSYKAVLTPVSGTASYSGNDGPIDVSVYKQGTSRTQGTSEYDGHTFTRYFESDGSAYIIALYAKEDAVFTNAEYLLYLEEVIVDVSFYKEELADTIAKVRNDITEPAIVCPIITDEHRYVSSAVQNFSDMVLNVHSFSESIECDAFVNLGDMVEGDTARTATKQYADSCNKDIKTIGLPYLFVSGNHDTNPYYNNKAQMFTPEEMFSSFYAMTKKVIFNMAENGTEYYIDFPEMETRCVFLNSSVASNDSIYSFGVGTGEWMANVALDTEYKVLLFVHVSPISTQVVGGTTVANSSAVRTAINNFIGNGGSIIQISGHSHRDMAFHSPYLSVMNGCQLFQNGDSETDGTATITGYIDAIVKPVREDGTATKDLWTVMVYKPFSNEIDFIRFGAGFDRYFHATPVGAGMLTSKLTGTLTWYTSDSNVATVSNGIVTEVGTGRCAVWAKETETGNYECWIVEFD